MTEAFLSKSPSSPAASVGLMWTKKKSWSSQFAFRVSNSPEMPSPFF